MRDVIDLARAGFRHKLGTYLVMTLLVAVTVAGYLAVSSYWADAATVSKGKAEPLNFPYLKAHVVHAYLSNPPVSNDPEVPSPPRKFVPLFNDRELDRIRKLQHVESLSVALSQDSFSRFGYLEFLSIEAGNALWADLDLRAGGLPQNSREILIPDTVPDASSYLGQVIRVRVIRSVFPQSFWKHSVLKDAPDPEPVKDLEVVGVYHPSSPMLSGLVGWLEVRRVDDYPELDPKEVRMDWPVPNTLFLKLDDPTKAHSVSLSWRVLYPEMPEAEFPMNPPSKVEWYPDLSETMMQRATQEVAQPVFANTINAFALGAIGIFAGMFLSFLDRRKELGIMKTVGIESSKIAATISTEVVFCGVLGTLAGILIAEGLTTYYITGITGNPIVIPWTAVVRGVSVAALLLIVATYIPNAMARQGTVMELLHGRPIPIVRKRA
ncbi:MAG TPA: ABC transporter permease [Firmicutes bacterium]|nr:ABC transporter permease [Candidatus Fermentithermobacillaceae bacterium]